MAMTSARWKAVSESRYAWEMEALEFVRERLPDREPYRAWANFEFVADDGSVNEVDLLLLTPRGFFLVEIKSRPGTLTGDSGTWSWINEGRYYTQDNPLILANGKAKKLVSLLKRQNSARKIRLPFLEALVFCSAPDLDCKLVGNARYRVCLRDREAEGDRPARPGIAAAVEERKCGGMPEYPRLGIDKPMAKAITRAVEQAGIRESHRKRRVGDYELRKTIAEGPGFQDWEAAHVRLPEVARLVRIYLVSKTASAEDRSMIERAALREFQLLESLQHQGVQRAHGFSEHEMGPAIIFEHYPSSKRFDHYLLERGERLGPDHRLHFLRQIAEIVQYAHKKRVVHRALSPQSVLVVDPGADFPEVKVCNWQTGYKAGGASSLVSRIAGTEHIDRLVEEASGAYMAPEAPTELEEGGEHLDVFSLGAIAYHLFSGRPPAADAVELGKKLRADKGLCISEVLNGAGEQLQELVRLSTHPDVTARLDSVADFLELLEAVEDELTTPDELKNVVSDPLRAQAGDVLPGGLKIVKRLGTGASSIAFLVEKDGEESIVKVALNPEQNDRLRDEAEVLEQMRHHRIVKYYESFEIGDRFAIRMRALSRRLKKGPAVETLRHWIAREGKLQMELLWRFGEDLLSAVVYLEEDKGISHRDIKPDNLAVANVGKNDKLHLVLFDFSLSRAPADNIRVGTRGYLDPFLPFRKHKRWDSYAERWAAAVTLYEMSTGKLPVWGDGKSDPALLDCEATLEAEIFDPEIREGLVIFFGKALRRDPDKRYDNADEMLRAWRDVFETAEKATSTSDHDMDTDHDGLLESARLDTQIPELGFSARALNALDRLNVLTVEELLAIPVRRVFRLRGVGSKTRKEINNAVRVLRERLGEGIKRKTAEDFATDDASVDPTPYNASVDLLADRIAKTRKTAGEDSGGKIVRALLGLDEGLDSRWPTQSEIGRHVGVTRARVGQVLKQCQARWSRNTLLTVLREDISRLLESNGGVTTLRETADALLTARGSAQDDPLRSRLAIAVIRAAHEVERTLDAPKFEVRRANDRIFICVSDEHAEYAARLGDAADGMAEEDPLLPPSKAMEILREVPPPPGETTMSNNRLIRLATASSRKAAMTARYEIYPVGMQALRALKLSHGALLGTRRLSAQEIRSRVESRYPEAEKIPRPPMLDRLLEQAGLGMKRESSKTEGEAVYVFPGAEAPSALSTVSTLFRYPTASEEHDLRPAVTEEIADARRFEERLVYHRKSGGFLAVTVTHRLYAHAMDVLQERFSLELFDMERVFLEALKETAREKKVDWNNVVRADAAAPEDRDWGRLIRLIGMAMPKIEQRLFSSKDFLLVYNAGMLARYDRMDLIVELSDRAGRTNELPGVWFLLPSDQQSSLPVMDGKAVPILGSGGHARVPEGWIRNVHRASKDKSEKKPLGD